MVGANRMQSETHFLPLTGPGRPFPFVSGETLPEVRLAYSTYGQLDADSGNAILLFHALSGTHHAAGTMRAVPGVDHYWTEELHRGWWNDFIGPGKPLDTDKFFIICPNTLGGCYGSTGPSSLNPETGKPYGKAFPHLTATDVVNSLLPLLDHFGIGRLHAIIGPSIGGLLALALAARHPERVHHVIPIASGVKTTVLNRLILFEQILAIENDPHFEGGDYYDRHPPVLGLALARMISHKTFVHLDAIERRARRSVVQSSDHFDWYQLRDPVESYILHQGKTFVDRFDANSYLRFVELWSGFDPVRETGAANMSEIFARCKAAGQEFLVFTIDSDFCFYPEEQSALVSHLRHAGVPNMHVTVHSDKGHDSFLLEPELYAPHLIYTLGKKPG
jgi:homoserine O-acetyltransferase